MKKLRLAVGAVLVLAALGAVGVGYQAGGGPGVVQAAPPDKPANELEALRKENELLKLNLQVVLEKVGAQENEILALRKAAARDVKGKGLATGAAYLDSDRDGYPDLYIANGKLFRDKGDGTFEDVSGKAGVQPSPRPDVSGPAKEAESALKALRQAKDKEGQRRAAEALDQAMKKLKEQLK